MQNTLKKLMEVLVCTACSGVLAVDSGSQGISCCNCGKNFKIVNNVPCFVPEELADFTEVPSAERQKFLEMKRVAYQENSFVSRMCNHYHRYAALKRREQGETRLTVDVGFGIGEHYPFITENEIAAASFIGVDLDRFKLEYFCSIHPEIPVLQASAFRLPFAGSSVDVVQFLATLEHFTTEEVAGLLEEVIRILKPGGVLIACYPAEGGLLLRLGQLAMHAYLKARTGFNLDVGLIHRHLSGAMEIRAILGANSRFERVESSFYPFGSEAVDFSLFVNELYRKR